LSRWGPRKLKSISGKALLRSSVVKVKISTLTCNIQRGWLGTIDIRNPSDARIGYSGYARTATGRVANQINMAGQGYLDFTYDYAGRLLSAVNTQGFTDMTQSFSYDAAGNMASNSRIGAYTYGAPAANRPHAPTSVAGNALSYDANGNMTSSPSLIPGFSDQVMSYDAENRPLSVTYQGDTTTYTYGADGSRLLRVEPSGDIVATFGPVEIRDFGGAAEEVLTCPHPNSRLRGRRRRAVSAP
jgi:YD repeat-containing protein